VPLYPGRKVHIVFGAEDTGVSKVPVVMIPEMYSEGLNRNFPSAFVVNGNVNHAVPV
jgi:hypothetical protein